MRTTLIVLGAALLAASAAHAEERRARIEVGGLWCPSCSYIVGEALPKSQSVEIVGFEPHETGDTAVYTITFDDAVTALEDIVARPAAYGCPAVLLDDESNS